MFGCTRMAVGATTWIAPRTAGLIFGLGNVADDHRAALVARLFGSRDLCSARAVVAADDAEAVRSALALGVAVDLLDVVATVFGVRRGRVEARPRSASASARRRSRGMRARVPGAG